MVLTTEQCVKRIKNLKNSLDGLSTTNATKMKNMVWNPSVITFLRNEGNIAKEDNLWVWSGPKVISNDFAYRVWVESKAIFDSGVKNRKCKKNKKSVSTIKTNSKEITSDESKNTSTSDNADTIGYLSKIFIEFTDRLLRMQEDINSIKVALFDNNTRMEKIEQSLSAFESESAQ